MKICVCGWYFNKVFYDTLEEVHPKYPVHIVAHKKLNGIGRAFPFTEIPNVGLEWGAYDYYLKNIWDGVSNVLFTHDDTHVSDIDSFANIAGSDLDCGFVFRSVKEVESNAGTHGRAVFMSAKFLEFCKNFICLCKFSKDKHSGFWYDGSNFGYLGNKARSNGLSCNAGIQHFSGMLEWIEKNEEPLKMGHIIAPQYFNGYRGDPGIDGIFKEICNMKYGTKNLEGSRWHA
jgi:hypothetical protein